MNKKMDLIIVICTTIAITTTILLDGCQRKDPDQEFLDSTNKEISQINDSYQSSLNSIDSEYDLASSTPDSSSYDSTPYQPPEKIVDTNGKKIWKIYVSKGQINFSGKYIGNGNFIIQVLDSNQDLETVVVNEIGDYVLDKTISLPNGTYYLEIQYTDGSYSLDWN